jgi:uncharacterized protein
MPQRVDSSAFFNSLIRQLVNSGLLQSTMHFDLIDFQLPIPLFPLPNCVLFPGVVQPLHIFEPRYQQMLAATLADRSLLTMALLKPGWEKNYHGTPAVHDMVCVGRIVTHEKLDDGKYNLLLHGVTRARILSQHKAGEPQKGLYRVARLAPVADSQARHPQTAAAEKLERQVLYDLFQKTSLKDLTITPSLQSLFDSAVPTARLIDVLSFTLIQDIPTKQRLLEELDPAKRGELLLHELIDLARTLENSPHPEPAIAAAWPPPLSTN